MPLVVMRLLRFFLIATLLVVAGINLWAWHHYREANRCIDRFRFSQAYTHYTQTLQIWRWSATMHFYAARAARRAGLYPEAEHNLAEYQRLQGETAETALPLALERLLLQAQSGDITAVEKTLWQYVERNKPETSLVLEALARGYVRVLRLSIAMNCLHRILERAPENVEALTMAGKAIDKGGGEVADAIKSFRRAVELDPERDDARLSLAQLLLRDNAEEARKHFEYVLARQPDNVEAMLGLGQTQLMLSDMEKARVLLEAVIAKEPENSKALTALGQIAQLDGKMTEAEMLFRKAIAADPANRYAHERLYQCLAQQADKDKEAAEEITVKERVEADLARLGTIVSQEMTRTPNDPKLHYEIGSFYLRYGKPAIGVRWLYSALKLDTNHQPSHQALYDYFQRTGDWEKAERHRSQLR
jgi:tetratricopeptide (TPR) repeat protein